MTGFQSTRAMHTKASYRFWSYALWVNLPFPLAPTMHDCRGPMRQAEGRQDAAEQRGSADDGAIANAGPVQQHAIGPDPYVIADNDAAAAWLEPLLTYWPIRISKRMIGRSQRAVRSDQHIATYMNAVARIQHTSGVDYRASPNYHVARPAGWLQ